MRKDSLERVSQKPFSDESGILLCGIETSKQIKYKNRQEAQTCFSENNCSSHFTISDSSLKIDSKSAGLSQVFVPVQRSLCMHSEMRLQTTREDMRQLFDAYAYGVIPRLANGMIWRRGFRVSHQLKSFLRSDNIPKTSSFHHEEDTFLVSNHR